jgi:hypothetical protein
MTIAPAIAAALPTFLLVILTIGFTSAWIHTNGSNARTAKETKAAIPTQPRR